MHFHCINCFLSAQPHSINFGSDCVSDTVNDVEVLIPVDNIDVTAYIGLNSPSELFELVSHVFEKIPAKSPCVSH